MEAPAFDEAELAELWSRWRGGQSMVRIGSCLGKPPWQVRQVLGVTGGIQPRALVRRPDQLSAEEREAVSRGLASGLSYRAIATHLGRAHTTISREVARNGGGEVYRAAEAERASALRRRRPKLVKLAQSAELRAVVEALLAKDWSPQQIARRLKMDYQGRPEMQISHEAIYRSLYIQGKGALRKELTEHLRRGRSLRQGRKPAPTGRGRIKDMVLISQRPPEAADRAVPGHWEGDLLLGLRNDALGTLVERSTRYLMLFKLPYRPTADDVRQALERTVVGLPESLLRSLTWDQGKEMAQHARFTVETGVRVYFCDPHSPWQRGTNENTNGLLRQYFPRNKSVRDVTEERLEVVSDLLNGRPRETLNGRTPAEAMKELIDNALAAGGAPTA